MDQIISFKKPPLPLLQIIPFLLIIILTFFFSKTQSISSNSTTCAPHDCGNGQLIHYPFWISGQQEPNCGFPLPEFNTTCKDKNPILKLSGDDYTIKSYTNNYNSVLLVQHELFDLDNNCPLPRHNFSVEGTPFHLGPNTSDLYFFYNCSEPYEESYRVGCASNDSDYAFARFHTPILDNNWSGRCQAAPINLFITSDNIDELLYMNYIDVLKVGFVLLWDIGVDCEKCRNSGGHCGSYDNGDFACFCKDHVVGRDDDCASGASIRLKIGIGRGANIRLKIGIGFGAAGGTAIVLCLIFFVMTFPLPWKTKENQELEALIKKFGSSTPRRYSYADIKKMTKSFKDEVGKGGYGVVYKGYLSNGNPVAVKLLNATKGNGEDFVNEIVSISKTSHVNVVSLLGFCFEGRKRAVLYEFMSNGSLEKHIRKESDSHMGLEGLYKIAIGVARGLEYLHGGCNTRILHFDIKPHNILLDEDLCPKISDFGLAKSYNRKESIVSMLEARGTIGYIAPEVFNRGFGVVSYKSDVYSYGMMLLEIVGARNKPTTIVELSNSSKTYFPDWAYQRVMRNVDQNLQQVDDVEREEEEFERKMILIGLWCIQTNPLHRPSMSKVIEMLEGSLEGLQIPPKPILHSPSIAEIASLKESMTASETTFSIENV